jgi:sarcosine dehydrogenase
VSLCFCAPCFSSFATRDFGWIRSQLPAKSDIVLNDVTTTYGVINVAGPNSRKLIQALGVEEDISNGAFPFMTWQSIQLACGVTVRALRVTFVGELGYELHVPMEMLEAVYTSLWRTAQAHRELGVRNGGYRCLETLRLEKGYRVWSSDLNPQTNPLEAGLGFCCKFGKQGGFIGEQALEKLKKEGGPSRKIVCFTIDNASLLSNKSLGFQSPDAQVDAELNISPSDPLFLYGNEAIRHVQSGKIVSYSTSAGFGYTVGEHIIYAYLPRQMADQKEGFGAVGEFEVNAFGTWVPMTRHTLNRHCMTRRERRFSCEAADPFCVSTHKSLICFNFDRKRDSFRTASSAPGAN